MLSRKFTTREKVLLLVMAIMLLGLFYYQVVYKQTEHMIAEYDTIDLENELTIVQGKAARKKKMEQEMAEGGQKANGEVATYNNITNEINELNAILANADTFNLSFGEAKAEGTTVRRDIQVSFQTGSYAKMKEFLQQLHDCRYRCLIRNVSVSADASNEKGINAAGDINVSLTVTFYETTFNAKSTEGLKTQEDSLANTSEDTIGDGEGLY